MKRLILFSSFKGKLLLLVTAAVLLPLLAVGIITGHVLQKRIYVSFDNRLQVALETIEVLLSRREEELEDDVDNLADDKSLETHLRAGRKHAPAPEPDAVMKTMLTAQRKILDVDWLALFDLEHRLLASDKFRNKNIALDFSAAGHFRLGQSDSLVYLIFIKPVKQRGEVLGYLAGGLSLNSRKITAYLHDKKLKGFALWLDDRLILTDLREQIAAPAKEGLADFAINGKEYRGAVRRRAYGPHRLQYAKFFPLAPLQRDLNKLVGTILAINAALFFIFLALLAGVANHMMRPLHQLTDYARLLASNRFTAPGGAALVNLAVNARDEIGKLARSFLHMQRQLEIHLRELAESTRANEKIQSELRIARHIQMSMLPRLTPALARGKPVEMAAAMEPAEQVGGDFYDFFMLDAQRLCLVIGDVSDKGLPAALFMAMSKTLLHAIALSKGGIAPHEVLTRANRELCRDNDLFVFVTIFFGLLNIKSGELHYSCGGHHPPYWLSAEHGVAALNHQRSAPLGVRPQARYHSTQLAVRPGDGLFLYTDGVIETSNSAGELFSEARLAELLRQYQHASAGEITRQILAENKKFSGAAPQHDDMAVLMVKYRPS